MQTYLEIKWRIEEIIQERYLITQHNYNSIIIVNIVT